MSEWFRRFPRLACASSRVPPTAGRRMCGRGSLAAVGFLGALVLACSQPNTASTTVIGLDNRIETRTPEVTLACLPRVWRDQPQKISLTMVASVFGPVLCGQSAAATEGAKPPAPDCYAFIAAGLVGTGPQPAQTGHGSTTSGAGFTVISRDGDHRAVVGESFVDIYDVATGARRSRTMLWDERNQKGLSASSSEGYFVGDILFLVDHDAGPHADIIAFTVDGEVLGEVFDEVYNGSINILDDNRIAFAGPAMTTIGVYDVPGRQMTRYRRSWQKPAQCSDDAVHEYLLEGDYACQPESRSSVLPADCCDQLSQKLGPYIGAPMGAYGKRGLLVAPIGARTGDVEIFDFASQQFGASKPLLCPGGS